MLSGSGLRRPWTLEERCAWLCPALDVNLYVERKEKRQVIGASDWISMKGSKLIQRLLGPSATNSMAELATLTAAIEPKLRVMRNSSGEVVGRACVFLRTRTKERRFDDFDEWFSAGVVSVGGFRS